MSTEFIIGTVIGLTGLIITIIMFVDWIRKRNQKTTSKGTKKRLLRDYCENNLKTDVSDESQDKLLQEITAAIYQITGKKVTKKHISEIVSTHINAEPSFVAICVSNKIDNQLLKLSEELLENKAPALIKVILAQLAGKENVNNPNI